MGMNGHDQGGGKLSLKKVLEVLEKRGLTRSSLEKAVAEQARTSPRLSRKLIAAIEKRLARLGKCALYVTKTGRILFVQTTQVREKWQFKGRGGQVENLGRSRNHKPAALAAS